MLCWRFPALYNTGRHLPFYFLLYCTVSVAPSVRIIKIHGQLGDHQVTILVIIIFQLCVFKLTVSMIRWALLRNVVCSLSKKISEWLQSEWCFAEGLPDPFAKVNVLGSKQWYTTKTCLATLNPDWNQQFHLWVVTTRSQAVARIAARTASLTVTIIIASFSYTL